jgi:hypothetical protein
MGKKPLCIDLFCGLGGWAEGFLAEGYDVIGFDIERHDYGTGGYPGQLVLQDVLTLDGRQFKNAAVIVASPPCQAYSYRAMPWTRARTLPPPDNSLFEACLRIAQEAQVPIIIENVRGAQKWIGKAAWHFGPYYLWGDVPALMPFARAPKVPGISWSGSDKPGYVPQGFNTVAAQNVKKCGGVHAGRILANVTGAKYERDGLTKTAGYVNKRDGHSHTRHLTNQRESDIVKQHGSGAEWFDIGIAKHSSKSTSRKAASAQIAKIPFPLAQHIAKVFKP